MFFSQISLLFAYLVGKNKLLLERRKSSQDAMNLAYSSSDTGEFSQTRVWIRRTALKELLAIKTQIAPPAFAPATARRVTRIESDVILILLNPRNPGLP
jgi:hypothetical protein